MITKEQVLDTIKSFFHENPASQYFMQLALRNQLGLTNSLELEIILDQLESEKVIGIRCKGSLRPGIMKGKNF